MDQAAGSRQKGEAVLGMATVKSPWKTPKEMSHKQQDVRFWNLLRREAGQGIEAKDISTLAVVEVLGRATLENARNEKRRACSDRGGPGEKCQNAQRQVSFPPLLQRAVHIQHASVLRRRRLS